MNPKLRQRVLSEWTGLPFPFSEPEVPANLNGVFQKAFKQIGLASRFQESTLAESWNDLIGPGLAAHCQPRNIRRGVLTVIVDHPAWMHQIMLGHKGNILKAVQERFPHLKIKDIRLKVG